jgi:uncharacterized membrane protein
MFCVKCGTSIAGASFCANCGTQAGTQANAGAPQAPAALPPRGFIAEVYSRSFQFLFKKPVLLWGLSLMYTLLTTLAVMVGFMTPFLWVPVTLVLQLGMASIYLNGLRGNAISSKQMFDGFNKKFFRNAGGMGWKSLWTFIWFMIPIAGWFVFYPMKFYAYRFVPYIMLGEPDIHATDALKKSMRLTKGYKGMMFLADLIIAAGFILLSVIFGQLARLGGFGVFLVFLYTLAVIALLPLLLGTLGAAYYDKVVTDNPDRN